MSEFISGLQTSFKVLKIKVTEANGKAVKYYHHKGTIETIIWFLMSGSRIKFTK